MARVIVIPARLASLRFPDKLLASETGKSLLQHTFERCCEVDGARVAVAADGERLAAAVRDFGGEVVLTDPELPTGTDRVAAACGPLGVDPARDLVVDVQGDEPEIDPGHVEVLFGILEREERAAVATLASERRDADGLHDPHRVKVVCDEEGFALYFSRSPIPFPRGGAVPWLCHVGIYGFRPGALARFAGRGRGALEAHERLEQLRFLEMGLRIRVGRVDGAAPGIDTPEDYRRFLARYRAGESWHDTHPAADS